MGKPASHCAEETAGADVAAPVQYGRRRTAWLLLTVIGAGLGALSLPPQYPGLVWNFTESVPVGLYRVEQATPVKGDIILLAPAGDARATLDAYHILPMGRLLIKELAAVAGDVVCRNNITVTINGVTVATARHQASDGRTLPVWSGCRALGADEIFVLAPHPASFDGRYFGPIAADLVAGVAHPLFTLPLSQERL